MSASAGLPSTGNRRAVARLSSVAWPLTGRHASALPPEAGRITERALTGPSARVSAGEPGRSIAAGVLPGSYSNEPDVDGDHLQGDLDRGRAG